MAARSKEWAEFATLLSTHSATASRQVDTEPRTSIGVVAPFTLKELRNVDNGIRVHNRTLQTQARRVEAEKGPHASTVEEIQAHV